MRKTIEMAAVAVALCAGAALGAEEGSNALKPAVVMLNGGVEGYTGGYQDDVALGGAFGLTVGFKANPVLGIEVAYSGAANNLQDSAAAGGATSGPDLIRNGAQTAVTVGLPTPIQPYLLAGIGVDHYSFRGSSSQFKNDTSGNVPLGAGIRTQIGNFTADLRADYVKMFANDFDQGRGRGGGRYQGILQIGGAF